MSLAAYFTEFTFTDVRAVVALVLFVISLGYFWARGFVKEHPKLKVTGRSKASKTNAKKRSEHSSDSDSNLKNITNEKPSSKISSKCHNGEKEKLNKVEMCNAKSSKIAKSAMQENKSDSSSEVKITAGNSSLNNSTVAGSTSPKASHVKNKRKKPGNNLSSKEFESHFVEKDISATSKQNGKTSERVSNHNNIDVVKNQDSDSEGAWIEVCRTKKK